MHYDNLRENKNDKKKNIFDVLNDSEEEESEEEGESEDFSPTSFASLQISDATSQLQLPPPPPGLK